MDPSGLAEAILATPEQRYRLLAENTSDVIALVAPAGEIVWASGSTEHVLGYQPSELVGSNTGDLCHFEDLRALLELRQRCDSGSIARGELRFKAASGEYRWMATVLTPARDSAGTVVARIDSLRDIDDEVHLRQALIRSERMFRLAMDGAPQGMAVVGLHRAFLQVNKALCQMLDRSDDWFLNHGIADVIHPEDLEGDLALRDELINGHSQMAARDCRWLRADGSPVEVQHSISLLRDEYRMPLFYVSHIQAHRSPERAPKGHTPQRQTDHDQSQSGAKHNS